MPLRGTSLYTRRGLREHGIEWIPLERHRSHSGSHTSFVKLPLDVRTDQVRAWRVASSLGSSLEPVPLRYSVPSARPKAGHSMATKKDTWAGGFWEALTYAWMRRPGIRVVPCTTSKYSISAPGPSSRGQSVPGVEALPSTSVVTHPWARQQQAWRRHMGDDLDLATVVPTEERPC